LSLEVGCCVEHVWLLVYQRQIVVAAVLIVSNLVAASLLGIKLDEVLAGNESAAQVDLLLSGIAACKGYHLLRIVFRIYLDILDINLVPQVVHQFNLSHALAENRGLEQDN